MGCIVILLYRHPSQTSHLQPELSLDLSITAATAILQQERRQPGILGRCSQILVLESAPTQSHVYTRLLFAAILANDPLIDLRVAALLPIIARVASACIRACGDYLAIQDTAGQGTELLSGVYNLIRLSLLAASVNGNEGLWERIWPDLKRVLQMSTDPTCVNGVSAAFRARTSANS
jgi:hypothetical protein